jgi:F-type H+-transporting ATPase subunit epsilon
MAEEMMLEIVTPEKMVFSDYVEEVTIPGGDGEFGALIGHAPLLSTVKIGELNYTKDNKKTYYAVGQGYAEVLSRKVTVLLDSAERADLIDRESARKAKEAAEAELSKISKEDEGYERASDRLSLAELRLKVAEKA